MLTPNFLVTDGTILLQIVQNPDKAYGGEKFGQQPVLQVVNKEGNLVNLNGYYVSVKMGSSPTGFEPLYILNDNSRGCYATGDDKCGVKVTGSEATTDVVQGIATFSVLLGFLFKLSATYKSQLIFLHFCNFST